VTDFFSPGSKREIVIAPEKLASRLPRLAACESRMNHECNTIALFTAATVSMESPPLKCSVLVIVTFALGKAVQPVEVTNSFCGVYTVSVLLAQSSTSGLSTTNRNSR